MSEILEKIKEKHDKIHDHFHKSKGKLFIISGVSGVGKNTILKELFKDETLHLAYSVSMTTRRMRFDEVNGMNYYFVTKEEFQKAIDNGDLLEYAEFCGNLYGTPKKFVDEKLKSGKNVILEIEVKGALNVMELAPDAISVFILPPSLEELEARLIKRGTESDDVIFQRLKEAKNELRYQEYYDYNVINDNVNQCVEEIKKIIKSGQKQN